MLKTSARFAVMAAVLCAAPALAEVKVNLVNAGHYTDAHLNRAYGKKAEDAALKEIERFFWKLGEAYLMPDETLTIDVLDVDMAGRFEPWQYNFENVRFMRDFTWPSMKLRYRLESPSRPAISGEELVADRFYLSYGSSGEYLETMPYEKIMLERWFRLKFAAGK